MEEVSIKMGTRSKENMTVNLEELEEAEELEYLRWFYKNADFGPADGDVRFYMENDFIKETGKKPPNKYLDEYTEDEE